MTGSCRSAPGAGFSPYCWIASDSWGHKLKCGTKSDCRDAALNWGNCVFASCAFDRGSGRSCDRMNKEKRGELKKECGGKGFSFDSWANRYEKARKLYDKFSSCVGGAIEEQTKKVIKYCHCLNSCEKVRLKMAPVQSKVWIGDWIWSWTSNHPTQRCKALFIFFISSFTKLYSLIFPQWLFYYSGNVWGSVSMM